jgi:hypothetical protein
MMVILLKKDQSGYLMVGKMLMVVGLNSLIVDRLVVVVVIAGAESVVPVITAGASTGLTIVIVVGANGVGKMLRVWIGVVTEIGASISAD